MLITERFCPGCQVTKSASEFGKNCRSKDGLQTWCKDCKRRHYQANRDSICARQGAYRAENRDKVLASKRKWYHSNPEERRRRSRQYRAENKAALKDRAQRRYGEGGRSEGKPWPGGRDVAYSTAHARVRATYGAAKNYICGCGSQAYAWSYDHSDPSPLIHKGVGLWANKAPVPYSPDPHRYDPLCRSCHVKRDRWYGE